MSGLIIEGICASGKSILFKGLSKRESYIEKQSKIQLSEYLTERIIENINPSVEDRVNLLTGYVEMLESIHRNFYNSRFKNTNSPRVKPCYLIERFHLTHGVESDDFNPFIELDSRLKNIDCKLVILTMDEEIIKERLEDTFHRRPQTWYNYVMSFGGLEGATQKYINMQNKLLDYSQKTSLPTMILDTTETKWEEYIIKAEELWSI